MVDINRFWELLDKGGVIFLSFCVALALVKGWLVPRWVYDKLEKDCDRMTEIALRSTDLAERGVLAAEKKKV